MTTTTTTMKKKMKTQEGWVWILPLAAQRVGVSRYHRHELSETKALPLRWLQSDFRRSLLQTPSPFRPLSPLSARSRWEDLGGR